MFETTTPLSSGAPTASPGAAVAKRRGFPLEHEAEFAEVQELASQTSFVVVAMATALLFHALLIAERQFLRLEPSFFALRGIPVTLGLLALIALPRQMGTYSRSLLCLLGAGSVVALVAGLRLDQPQTLLALETGVAALILLAGYLARLPMRWTALLSGGMLLADAVSLASSQGSLTLLKLDSLFAPAFATAFTLLAAWVRREEARREFLATRAAAFAGIEANAAEISREDRHLDPVTGIGSRPAFDMRLRAAWDQATSRRNSVALLLFSIDEFHQKKRDHGYRYGDLLQSRIAGMLKEGLRRSDDMVARFDVHHFVVMLPGVGTDGATQIAERLRGCIEELVVYVGPARHRVTVTVGVASLRAKRSVQREKLIEAATRALEQAKHSGNNVVCVEGRGCLPRMA